MVSVFMDFDEAFRSKTGIPSSTVNDAICVVAAGCDLTLWIQDDYRDDLLTDWLQKTFSENQKSRIHILKSRPKNWIIWFSILFNLKLNLGFFDYYYLRLFPFVPQRTKQRVVLRIDDPFGTDASGLKTLLTDLVNGVNLKLALARSIRTSGYNKLRRRADIIHVFNSNFTERTWRSIYKTSDDSVIIYPPVQFSYPKHKERKREVSLRKILDTDLKLPYFIFIGGQRQRKNPASIINCWAQSNFSSRAMIVVVGDIPRVHLSEESARLQKLGLLKFYNNLEVDRLEKLIRGASALVFNSNGEGFGNPIAEAIFLGIPVICNNLEPFKEIGIRNTLFFESGDFHHAVSLMSSTLDGTRKKEIDLQSDNQAFSFEEAMQTWKNRVLIPKTP